MVVVDVVVVVDMVVVGAFPGTKFVTNHVIITDVIPTIGFVFRNVRFAKSFCESHRRICWRNVRITK